jgi:hypothetical protein
MRKRRIPESDIKYFKELLDDPESLIGVAFFVKEAGQVVVLGDIAGCGVASQADNLWEAIENFDLISRMSDGEIADQFGDDVVQLAKSDEELMAKTAAVESLKTKLLGLPGIVDVRSTPTSIAVITTKDGQYEGPWEWDGYSVYAEVEV